MISRESIDGGLPFDWGRASADYAVHRPGYPASFFELLRRFDIGLSGQRVLDVATGPGVLAVPLAKAGAVVTGIDIAGNQIEAARAAAAGEGVAADFRVADAHDTGLDRSSFNVVTASMCMHYFDHARFLSEVKRLLVPGGVFLVASLIYLPRHSTLAAQSERLILEHNPEWAGADFDEEVRAEPGWSREALRLRTFHRYVEPIEFTRESWRGRVRACRGVGASMTPVQVQAFDRAHAELLERDAPERFAVPHLITIQLFEMR